jgi:hypothetical protein
MSVQLIFYLYFWSQFLHNNFEVDTLIKWPVSPHLLHAVAPPLSVNAKTAARQDGKCNQETCSEMYGLVLLSWSFLSGR